MFRLVQVLRQSREKSVYVLWDEGRGCRVIAKLFRQPVVRELAWAQYLSQTSIVCPQLLAWLQVPGLTIIIEEYISGQPLSLDITSQELPALVQQLFRLLQTLLHYNIVHDDLHLDNLLWTSQQQLYVIDFGMAQLNSSSHHRDICDIWRILNWLRERWPSEIWLWLLIRDWDWLAQPWLSKTEQYRALQALERALDQSSQPASFSR